MVKEIKRFMVLDAIEMDSGYYQLIPPLECEITISEFGYAIKSSDIEVKNCKSYAQAVQIFETMLQECVIAGRLHINMDTNWQWN